MLRLLRNAIRGIPDLVFPPHCSMCGGTLNREPNPERFDLPSCIESRVRMLLCTSCLPQLLPKFSRVCGRCGAHESNSFEESSTRSQKPLNQCVRCRSSRFHFQHCYSLGNYERSLRDAVLRVKSGNEDLLGIACGGLLAARVADPTSIDLVLPIPVFWFRRLQRQSIASEVLAREVARNLKRPVAQNALKYTRLTSKQGTLSFAQRLSNVKGAFRVGSLKRIRNRNLLIVDDVMTSGATVNEASRICLDAGAKSVTVAVLARGVGRSKIRN